MSKAGGVTNSPGKGSAKVDADNKPVVDGRGVLGRFPDGAVDGLGGTLVVVCEVGPAVAVPLAWRRVQGQGDAHGGGG